MKSTIVFIGIVGTLMGAAVLAPPPASTQQMLPVESGVPVLIDMNGEILQFESIEDASIILDIGEMELEAKRVVQ